MDIEVSVPSVSTHTDAFPSSTEGILQLELAPPRLREKLADLARLAE
jgi:hypothetical protein